MKTRTLKIIIFLFFLNTITLFLYFSSHPDYLKHHSPPSPPQPLHHFLGFPQPNSYSKPWPILPSYLPWSQNPNVKFGSCEAYFGNGFTRPFYLLNSSSSFSPSGPGWFRCFKSDTLLSSVCEAGIIRMNPAKINMSHGGEVLESVIGREEDDELPFFHPGAFDIRVEDEDKFGEKLVTPYLLSRIYPHGEVIRHTMRDLMNSIVLVPRSEFKCSEWVDEPTLLVTRFEYANLFHTVTDWYAAYVASRVTGLPNRPHLVFVDGHCMAPLEETWRAMFSSLRYAKNFSGPVCFRHAILSPLGYETVLFKGLSEDIDCHGGSAHDLWQQPDERRTARISEFGEMIRASFGFPVDRHQTLKPGAGLNVLFVRREDYLAHPRHHGKVQSRLSNEQQLFDSLKLWASQHVDCKINLVNGIFAHMPMKEQVRTIHDASVIIGAHGAGLTHIVSASPKAVILEIVAAEFMRPHFTLIAKWRGLEYHPIFLQDSYAKPLVVKHKLNDILKSLGC
ncbi:putative beta-(1,2)-xylosyltransferase [Heracleum sosnowskyi]|uniref:Beta-(1,2)-xylosyltransferase n=1 Tax=Heracleum sosnowskyi TaxID=360622 RepID=A0AAD8N205_9APIA|nr:putative beta-(1,2)-xylosyltransferase [Heracleum sosnowskyi]